MKSRIIDHEKSISEIIVDPEFTKGETIYICQLLGIILTDLFSKQNRETGLRSWCVDDMYADKVEVFSKKITMIGTINWLGGGANCVNYQVDIGRDTDPLLYSYKLNDRRWNQIMYVGKTFNGWIIKPH